MLKPAAFARAPPMPSEGIVRGNIYATTTLVVLFLITSSLVLLDRLSAGRRRPAGHAGARVRVGAWYFAGIGLGFMLVQMAVLQRFSIYLGHPTHAVDHPVLDDPVRRDRQRRVRPCRA
jgi:hypothetical protein